MDDNLQQLPEENNSEQKEKKFNFRFGLNKGMIILLFVFLVVILVVVTLFLLNKKQKEIVVLENSANTKNTAEESQNTQEIIKREGQMILKEVKKSNQELSLDVLLNTQDTNVVVVSAVIKYDNDFLELEEVDNSQSVLPLAVIKDIRDGEIEIVRAAAGDGDYLDKDDGFTGESGLLVNLKFKILQNLSGQTNLVEFDEVNSKMILDDAQGTAMILDYINL